MNKNKSFFVKALSSIGPLIIMLNIASVNLAPPVFAMFSLGNPPSGRVFFQPFQNNQATPANNNLNDDIFTPWYDPNQLGNPQLNLGNTGVSFDLSEYISNPLMPIVNPSEESNLNANAPDHSTESTFNPSYFSVSNANSINNVHTSNGFQPPNYFGTGYGNNGQFSNLQSNNTPAPSGDTLPWLKLSFAPGPYDLKNGRGFRAYLRSLYGKKVIMSRNIAFNQAKIGLNLAQTNVKFFQALQERGITPDEIRNARLPKMTARTSASEIYRHFAQNHRVWAAIFDALIDLGLVS